MVWYHVYERFLKRRIGTKGAAAPSKPTRRGCHNECDLRAQEKVAEEDGTAIKPSVKANNALHRICNAEKVRPPKQSKFLLPDPTSKAKLNLINRCYMYWFDYHFY